MFHFGTEVIVTTLQMDTLRYMHQVNVTTTSIKSDLLLL